MSGQRRFGYGAPYHIAATLIGSIGNTGACSCAQHAAAGIRHCHFDKSSVCRNVADSAVRLGWTIETSHPNLLTKDKLVRNRNPNR
jgi:hypothetical protein